MRRVLKLLIPVLMLIVIPSVVFAALQDAEYEKVELHQRINPQIVLSPTLDDYFPSQTCWGDRFDVTISGHTGDLIDSCHGHINIALWVKLWEADRGTEPTGDDEILYAFPIFPTYGATWGIPYSYTFENVHLAPECYEVFFPLLIPTYTGEFYVTVSGRCLDGVRSTTIENVSLLFHPSEAPALTAPANQDTVTVLTATLQWSGRHGSDSFYVQLDDEDDFNDPIVNEQTGNTSIEVSGLVDETTYFWHVRAHNNTCGDGSWSGTSSFHVRLQSGVEDIPSGVLPDQYALSQNYPNPFNMMTTIEFHLPQAGPVKIDVLNLLGQNVRTLLDEKLSPGNWSVTWDGLERDGNEVSSGVYLYRMRAGSFEENRKMILLK